MVLMGFYNDGLSDDNYDTTRPNLKVYYFLYCDLYDEQPAL